MRKLYYLFGLALLTASLSATTFAQRPRVAAEPQPAPEPEATTTTRPQPTPEPAPKLARAKYMGGYFGLKQKQEGTLSFDDRNHRLVFRDKQEREVISIPYDAVVATFADSEERRTMGQGTTTAVMSGAGILGLPALLLKKKFEYFTIQFKDPDTEVEGTTQFKMKDKPLVSSMAHTLAQKAGLSQRGQVYVRRKDSAATTEKNETVP